MYYEVWAGLEENFYNDTFEDRIKGSEPQLHRAVVEILKQLK